MTAKQEAFELVRDMYNVNASNSSEYGMEWDMAKECALISVDKILTYQEQLLKNYKVKLENSYWENVKQEIKKL